MTGLGQGGCKYGVTIGKRYVHVILGDQVAICMVKFFFEGLIVLRKGNLITVQ